MAQEYIVIDDINNKLFKRPTNDAMRQEYVDLANIELEDLAIRKGVDPSDIPDVSTNPVHPKLKRYAIQYALSLFAEDRIGSNNSEGAFNGEDVYESLFKRTRYLIQNVKQDITPVMFTGEEQTEANRAVMSQRIYRG